MVPDRVPGAVAVNPAVLIQDDVGRQVSVVVVGRVEVCDDSGWDPQAAQKGVEDGGVDPALSVADGHLGFVVAEQDVCAAGPGGGRHAVGVVAVPVPHQHAIVITRVQLRTTNDKFLQFSIAFFLLTELSSHKYKLIITASLSVSGITELIPPYVCRGRCCSVKVT